MKKNDFMNRSGNFVLQPSGYTAFIPRPLPPQPPVHIDEEMLDLLSMADRALGRLDGSADVLPNPDLFVAIYVQKEALLSSQIEGTQASLLNILEYEAKVARRKIPADVAEVVNYIHAINYGLERLNNLPLSLRLIRKIHDRLLSGVRGGERNPGEFRKRQNWIGPRGGNLQNAIFVPPPPQEMEKALHDFELFLHDTNPMPLLIKCALIHSQFETIHPFIDGNGRIGRLLIIFLLCQQKVLKRPILYLSLYFKKYRQEYYDRLQSVRTSGDWENWIKFFLKGIYEVSQQATDTARAIILLREKHRQEVNQKLRQTINGYKLLEFLFQNPVISVKSVTKNLNLAFPTANSLIDKFQTIGILSEITGRKRDRLFIYDEYFDIMNRE